MFLVYYFFYDKISRLVVSHKEQVLYLIFGGFTTLINMVVYYLARQLGMQVIPADIVAWILAVIFAYVTNKIWVFESKSWKLSQLSRELLSFFGARLFSLGVDALLLYLTVEIFHLPQMLMKLLINIIVIILNYLFSKLLVFRKPNSKPVHAIANEAQPVYETQDDTSLPVPGTEADVPENIDKTIESDQSDIQAENEASE